MAEDLFIYALRRARKYAQHTPNPLTGGDPDDIAEVWNELRDHFDQDSGGELTARELDVVAGEALKIFQANR